MKLILASGSPRRKELLKMTGLKFDVVTSDADESIPSETSPGVAALMLSERKALAVANLPDCKGSIVIGADTIVSLDGQTFGKPKDEDDAERMLTLLSDGWHEVYTGIALQKNGKLIIDFDVTHVRMRKMEPAEIKAYIKTKEPMDKAGAYAVQDVGSIFVSRLDGSFHNVMGLPISLVCDRLSRDYGIHVLE